MDRSELLYSLGNIDPNAKHKYRYYKLAASEGGIGMGYMNHLPWQKVRPFTMPYDFCVTDIRGSDTYYRKSAVPTEELVVLYEFLKAEGADLQLL